MLQRAAWLVALVSFAAAALGTAPVRAEDTALARLTSTLAHVEARDGETSPKLLPVIDELAAARMQAGALAAAADLRRRALDIAIAAYGSQSARAAAAMAALAQINIARGRYLDAEPLLIVADRVLSDAKTADPARLAAIEAGLAQIALARGDTERAERWSRQAVSLAARGGGAGIAAPLRALGAVLARQHKFGEGEQVLRRALAQDRRQHGDGSVEAARSLSQLGRLFLREHRADRALRFLEKAAAIDRDRLGSGHPLIADDLLEIGIAEEALHRDSVARLVLHQALAVLVRGGNDGAPRLAYIEIELGHIDERAGNGSAAHAALKAARRILNKAETETRRREREI